MTAELTFDPPTLSSVGPTTAPTSPGPVDLAGWVRGVGEAITGLRACLDDDDVTVRAGDVLAIERLYRRLAAARLAALAKLDAARRADATDDPSGTTDQAAADTGSWLARSTRTDGAAAASDTTLARRLSTDADLNGTRDALDEGSLSTEHAKVIAKAMKDLPDGLSPAERARIERHLVEQARILDPARLRRAARRALQALQRPEHEVDDHHGKTLQSEEEKARAKTRLTLHDNGDGTTSGHFTVPTLAASILRKIIEQMTAPRRQRSTSSPAQTQAGAPDDAAGQAPTCRPAPDYTGRDGVLDGAALGTDWAHARGLAFMALLEHLPTDHLHGKTAATIVATLDHDKLVAGLGAAGVDTGIELSAGEARRLACTAGLVPAVLGTGSLPLDLGRANRLFTETQRLALATLYDTCAVDGCDRPFAWSELHHLDPWATGGRTDLANAVPACCFHHHRLDDPRYEHTVVTDARGKKTIFLTRRR